MHSPTVAERPPAAAPRGPGGQRPLAKPPLTEWLSSPFVLATAACLAVAALSAAVLPTVPSYDPWAWIVWGREVFDPHLSFATGGGPSWKPLPVIFTAVYGLFGAAAPTLWVITARAGGLLALVAAYRLAAPLMAPGRGGDAARGLDWSGVAAGVIAAAGLLLTQEWFYYLFRGTSEPMLVASSLWALERHLSGRPGSAFVFAVAACLIRPEAWPFTLVYAVWLWRGDRRLRQLIILGLAAIPLLWFVPPWIGSNQPFLAASHAKQYNGHLGSHPFLEVLRRGVDLQTAPVLIAAVAAVGITWFRYRDRLVLALAGCAAVWWVLVVAMTLAGYPGLERFYLPAAGVTCVLAAVGIVRIAGLAGATVRGVGRYAIWPRALSIAVAIALIAITVPFVTSRIDSARAQPRIARHAVTRLDQLSAAVAAVGGHDAVFPCHSSFSAVNHGVQTALAWKLHVTLGRVGTTLRHQGVLFIGPHDSIDGQPAPVSVRLTRMQLLAQVGAWRVYRVTRPGGSTRCVGR
jgi:hypothetical protein